MIRDSIVSDQGSTVCDQGQHCLWSKSALFVIRVSTVYDQSTLFMFGSALLVIRAALSDVRATLFVISISTVCDQGQHCLWLGSTVWHQSQDCLGSGSAMFVIRVSTICDQGSNVYEAQHCWSGSAPRPGQHCFRKGSALFVIRAALFEIRVSVNTVNQDQHWDQGSTVWDECQHCLWSGYILCDQSSTVCN